MSVRRELHTPRLRPRRLVDAGWALVWVAAVAGIEVAGRIAGSELLDVALLAGAFGLALVMNAADGRREIRWLAALFARARDALGSRKAFWGACGLDMQGGSDVADGLPTPRVGAVIAVIALCVPAVLLAPHLPGGLRVAGQATSYTLYLAVLVATMAVSAFAVIGMALFAAGILGDALIRAADNRGRPRSGRSPTARQMLFPLVAALVLSLAPIPALVPAAGILGCLLSIAGIAALPRFRRVRLIWRRAGGPPRRAGLGVHMLLETSLVGGVGLLIVTLGTGLDLGDPDTHALTSGLAEAAAWSIVFGLGALTWRVAAMAGAAGRGDPAEPGPRVVRPSADLPADVSTGLAAAGWRIRPPGAVPLRGEVVVDPSQRDLGSDQGLAWLARRHEIVQRRHLRRGLRRLLRAAARFTYDQGAGFWIAPHLWIVPSLSRDKEEDESIPKGTGAIDQVLGPDHETVFPLSARAHARCVFDATGIDLIFVEDGVRWRGLRRVLGVVFEVYDIHGGERRVRDRDFSGLTGLRVVLHEFNLDNPYKADGYPEPDYEEVARARVLHVFRDRGGEEEDVEAPAPGDRVPLLVG